MKERFRTVGEAVTVVVAREPRVVIRSGRLPFPARVLAGLALVGGLELTLKKPNIVCEDKLRITDAHEEWQELQTRVFKLAEKARRTR